MGDFPKHIILSDKVYNLSFSGRIESGRAFTRELVDFLVEIQNPLNDRDKATTYVGTSRELFHDYPSFRIPVPLEWILGRFLARHIRSNSLGLISGSDGDVLKTTTFKPFLGQLDLDDREVDRIIIGILSSWIRVFPEKSLPFSDIYVSTDIQLSKIERGINGLIFMGYIEKLSNSLFKVLPKVLDGAESSLGLYPSEKTKSVEATKMPSIFLSHNSKDKFFVRELADRLSRMGVKVWIDEAEIKVGDSLTQKVGKAIEETDFVGVVLSKNSINSQWVQKELQIALQEEFRKNRVVVLPLLLESVDLPAFLKDKLYADFTTPEKFKESFPKLLDALCVPHEKIEPIIEQKGIEEPVVNISKADRDLSNFVDIKIQDLDLGRSYKPDEGKMLYNMYFRLSASPSEEWKQIFIAERRFPRHTMWREAWVENNFIVIHCVPEELEKYHVGDLKEDIVNANTKYRKYLFEQAQKEIREREQEKDEADKLQNLRKRLDLS